MKDTGITGALEPFKGDETHYVNTTEWGATEIIFFAYHDGENVYDLELTKGGARCDHLFDRWADGELCEEFGLDADQVLRWRTTEFFGLRWMRPVMDDLVKEADGQSVLVLRGTKERLRNVVKAWLERVAEEASGVGGDDSYFDYYPDNFYVARQICPFLDLEAELEAATRKAVDLRYDDDSEDCLGQSRYGL